MTSEEKTKNKIINILEKIPITNDELIKLQYLNTQENKNFLSNSRQILREIFIIIGLTTKIQNLKSINDKISVVANEKTKGNLLAGLLLEKYEKLQKTLE
jgi:hypothetical protein